MQGELDEEYMELYAPGYMVSYPLYGKITYNSSLSNAFKLQLEHNVILFLVEMKAATGQDIVEHVMRPAKVISATLVMVSYTHC
jgi:hypothetical protein